MEVLSDGVPEIGRSRRPLRLLPGHDFAVDVLLLDEENRSAYMTYLERSVREMPVNAETQFHTEYASRCLARLCQQFDDRARGHPEWNVRVEWSDASGEVDFGWARCTLRAAADSLAVRIEADDRAALEQVTEVVTRHLETLGPDAADIRWRLADTPSSEPLEPHDRREATRRFHRRVRH